MTDAVPWTVLAALVGPLFAALAAGLFALRLHYLERGRQRHHEVLQERKRVLFDALQVIDCVYSNVPFYGQPPLNPQPWDIKLARDAFNKMIIYCTDPNRIVDAFSAAIGLHNPTAGGPRGIYIDSLQDFRKEVARELEMPAVKFADPDMIWIYSLSGTREAEERQRRNASTVTTSHNASGAPPRARG